MRAVSRIKSIIEGPSVRVLKTVMRLPGSSSSTMRRAVSALWKLPESSEEMVKAITSPGFRKASAKEAGEGQEVRAVLLFFKSSIISGTEILPSSTYSFVSV